MSNRSGELSRSTCSAASEERSHSRGDLTSCRREDFVRLIHRSAGAITRLRTPESSATRNPVRVNEIGAVPERCVCSSAVPDAVYHRSAPAQLWEIYAVNDHQPFETRFNVGTYINRKTESESRGAPRKWRERRTVLYCSERTPSGARVLPVDNPGPGILPCSSRQSQSDRKR